MRVLQAFLGRDWAYQKSAKFTFVGQLLSVLMLSAMMYFIGKTFLAGSAPALRRFGGNYFEFALIGIIFARFQSTALTSFASAIRRDQTSGTLEAMLVSRTSVQQLILSAGASAFVFTAIQATMYLFVGAGLFGVNLHHVDVWSSGVVLLLSMLAIAPIGICAAAAVIAFRQGDSAIGMLTSATNVFGGVYFPISVLPGPLRMLAAIFPITHGLAALRLTILRGAGVAAVGGDVAILAGIALVGVPLSLALFMAAIHYARRVGSLAYM